MAGRQSGFNAATSFATIIVLTLGYVFSLAVTFAFSQRPEWNAFIVSTAFVMLALWLLVPKRGDDGGLDDLGVSAAANRKVVTKTHHYKLKKIRKRSGRMGSNRPPSAEEIREIKESSVMFVPPPAKSRLSESGPA